MHFQSIIHNQIYENRFTKTTECKKNEKVAKLKQYIVNNAYRADRALS